MYVPMDSHCSSIFSVAPDPLIRDKLEPLIAELAQSKHTLQAVRQLQHKMQSADTRTRVRLTREGVAAATADVAEATAQDEAKDEANWAIEREWVSEIESVIAAHERQKQAQTLGEAMGQQAMVMDGMQLEMDEVEVMELGEDEVEVVEVTESTAVREVGFSAASTPLGHRRVPGRTVAW